MLVVLTTVKGSFFRPQRIRFNDESNDGVLRLAFVFGHKGRRQAVDSHSFFEVLFEVLVQTFDAENHFESLFFQLGSDRFRGIELLVSRFRMVVHPVVHLDDSACDSIDFHFDGLLQLCHLGRFSGKLTDGDDFRWFVCRLSR